MGLQIPSEFEVDTPDVGSVGPLANQIAEAVLSGKIVVARGLTYSVEQLLEFGRHLGDLFFPAVMPPGIPLALATQLQTDTIPTAQNWHNDQSFCTDPPDWSALYCVSPGASGSSTVFADASHLIKFMSAGFLSVLIELSAHHVAYYGDKPTPEELEHGASHPLIVRVEGDEPALFATPSTVVKIDGWSQMESAIVLKHLFDMLNWPEITIVHHWNPGDLVVWPNWRYPHRALPYSAGKGRHLVRLMGHWPSDSRLCRLPTWHSSKS